jgi:8-oxo-dGTP diphosphatase
LNQSVEPIRRTNPLNQSVEPIGRTNRYRGQVISRYQPILGTLVYVFDEARQNVLLVHRTARPDDEQLGMWNGLGGKVHADEDVVTSVQRELGEEANISATDLTLRGTISWPGFGPNNEDWFGFIFLATSWTGDVPERNDEGPLSWCSLQRVLAACDDDAAVRTASGLRFFDGDRFFVPLVFDEDPRAFHGVMPYSAGHPTGWNYVRL